VKTKSIERLFLHILIYTFLLLPAFLVFSRNKTRERMLIGAYGITCFLMLSSYFYGYVKSSFLYFTVYTFLEYISFTSLLWLNIKSKGFKLIILFFSFLFIGFQIFTYVELRTAALDSIPVGIETILIFIYIAFYFYESFQDNQSDFIYNQSCFWLCIGMMIYLGGTFFFNILLHYLDQRHVDQYWFLTYVADIIKNLFFVASIVLGSTPSKEKLHHQKHLPHLDFDMN